MLAKRQKLNINIRNFKYAVFFILILFLLTVGNSFSQTIDSLKQKDFSKLTLQELIETEISVTNQINIPLNESPGIVSVITEEEIKNADLFPSVKSIIDHILNPKDGTVFTTNSYHGFESGLVEESKNICIV